MTGTGQHKAEETLPYNRGGKRVQCMQPAISCSQRRLQKLFSLLVYHVSSEQSAYTRVKVVMVSLPHAS